MTDVPRIFDRSLLRKRRDRASAALADHDYLFHEIGNRLAERLADVRRTFPRVLDLGSRTGVYAPTVVSADPNAYRVHSDLSHKMVSKADGLHVVADEELLPFADGSFDLIVSILSLHWVNDLPGTLIQINRCLSPDGLFLAALFGGGTLTQLRNALAGAELAGEGGVRPRVSPFADVRDCGNLLQRAGFALPVADSESVTVMYRDPLRVLKDLRGMGEANAVAEQARHFTRRATMLDALARLTTASGENGEGIPITFDIVFLSGWAPDASQPKPLARGTGRVRLTEALASK